MKLVIFGRTVSSLRENGHASLWRGLCRAMIRRGHDVVFFEHDLHPSMPHRDLNVLQGGCLCLYSQWDEEIDRARQHLDDADVAIVASSCPDRAGATELVLSSRAQRKVFYDLDTTVTLGENANGPHGLCDFDLVLSSAGGGALDELRLRARSVAALYGCIDPEVHFPLEPQRRYRADLSWLAADAEEDRETLEHLFIEPARRLPHLRFLAGGAHRPENFASSPNIGVCRDLPASEHAAFFSSSHLTLNVTPRAMIAMGWCPAAQLFEAAACGAPIVTDWWEGLDRFFEPGSEVLVAQSAADVVAILNFDPRELRRIALAARSRVLEQHTADHRVIELESLLESASPPAPAANTLQPVQG